MAICQGYCCIAMLLFCVLLLRPKQSPPKEFIGSHPFPLQTLFFCEFLFYSVDSRQDYLPEPLFRWLGRWSRLDRNRELSGKSCYADDPLRGLFRTVG